MFNYRRPVASFTRNSIRSATPLTLDQLARYTPSVLADEAHHSCSDEYSFIPTIQIVRDLFDHGFAPYSAAQSNTRIADKRAYTKHVLRFRHADFKAPSMVGDVFPEVVLTNSHDGASSFQLDSGFFRLVCTNGMVAPSANGEQIRVRHTGNVSDNVIDGCTRILDELQIGVSRIEEFQSIQLSRDEQVAFATAALQLRWGDGAAPVDGSALLNINRHADVGNDLWKTLNKVQEAVVRGGLRGRNATGNRIVTRAVTGISEDIKLNKALWSLADSMAALKGGQSFSAAHDYAFAA